MNDFENVKQYLIAISFKIIRDSQTVRRGAQEYRECLPVAPRKMKFDNNYGLRTTYTHFQFLRQFANKASPLKRVSQNRGAFGKFVFNYRQFNVKNESISNKKKISFVLYILENTLL